MANEPKTLLLDLETAPTIGYVWGGRKWDVNIVEYIEEGNIISFAWKWLGDKTIGCKSNRLYSRDYRVNNRLITELHKLYSAADYVVGHNLFAFDDKVANTDILLNGMPPPPRHRVIDTLKIARQNFRFNSNKLDDLAARLKIGRKLPTTGFQMWKGCMANEAGSWDLMERYNKHDIFLLEGVWERFAPWYNRPALPRIRK
jgi:hypothetical protein